MRNIGILIFDQVEAAEPALFNVFTVSKSLASVQARAGLRVLPDYDFNTHPNIDVLIVPGGVVTEQLANQCVIGWLKTISAHCSLIASVCTGAFLLAHAGLLDDKTATTHWEDQDDLRQQFPTVTVQADVRWIDHGELITSAGICAGIDMCLHLVERLAGRALAQATARQMEFVWTETYD